MSTALEDRLTAALAARADLVQPEQLHPVAIPEPTTTSHRWRRPAVVALVAAAAVVAVVVPLASRHGDAHDEPAVHIPLPVNRDLLPKGRFSQPQPKLTDRLTGDVDGDGQPDQVRSSRHGLTLTLAADPAHPIAFQMSRVSGLAGFTPDSSGGLAVVMSDAALADGDEWLVLGLRRGKLVVLQPGETAVPKGKQTGIAHAGRAVVPGYLTSWLASDGTLLSGALDPMQHGRRRLSVDVLRTDVGTRHLVETRLGRWCWDVETQAVPAPCPAGQDDAFDAGPHSGLPKLLPHVENEMATGDTWHDRRVSLHMEQGPVQATQELQQVYDVVGTVDGHPVRARAGDFIPALLKSFVDLGHGVEGFAVKDADSGPGWNFLSYVDHTLVPAVVRSNLRPGEPFDTWVAGGEAFTRVPHGTVGHYELYRWEVSDASGASLVPVDLGQVCMDDFEQTYGTCTP